MSWQSYSQQGTNELLDTMGKELSLQINCPVRHCAAVYEKPIFQCKCDKNFPEFAVRAAYERNDWSQIIEHHNDGC